MSGTEFKDSEFGRFQDGTQKVIRLAQLLGWKVEWRNAGRKVLGLTSPNRHKTFNIPTTNVNSNRVASYISSLWHHTDRGAWADVFAGHDDLKHDPLLASIVTVLGVSLYTEADRIAEERYDQGRLSAHPVEGEQPLRSPTDEGDPLELGEDPSALAVYNNTLTRLRLRAAAKASRAEADRIAEEAYDKGHLPDLEQRLRVRGEQPLPITEFDQPTEEDEVDAIAEHQAESEDGPVWFRAPMFDEYGSEWWSARIDGDIFFECRAHEEPFRTNNSNSRGSHTGSHSPAWQEGRERAGVTKHNRRIISRTPWRRKSDGEVSTAIIDEGRADGSHTYLCAQCRKFRSPSPQAVGGHSASHRKAEPKVQVTVADPVPAFEDLDLSEVSTPETTDLIDKVRALLGNPVDDAHIRRLEDKVTLLEEKNQHLQGLVDFYRTKATKAEGDLATLAELIQSVRPS